MTPEVIAIQILHFFMAAAATPMAGSDAAPTPQQTAKAWGMIALIAMAGLIMLILLVGLIVMRRADRARLRHSRQEHAPAPAAVDAWSESAKRMNVDPEPEED